MQVLAATYYLSNFEYLLQFVVKQYKTILTSEEIAFTENFLQLSVSARCLYVRMANRKGNVFANNTLQYAEIPSTTEAIAELEKQGFISKVNEQAIDFFEEIIQVFTKKELLLFLQHCNPSLYKSSKTLKIKELHNTIFTNIPYTDFLQAIPITEIIIQKKTENVNFYKFLFFGNAHQDMTEFVLRDMGIVKFNTFADSQFTALFQSRAEADEKWKILEIHHFLSTTLQAENFSKHTNEILEKIAIFFVNWFVENPLQYEISSNAYQKLAIRLGNLFEKHKNYPNYLQISLDFYRYASISPSPERQTRILYHLGRYEESLAMCEAISQQPQNATEASFAKDFGEKLQKMMQKTSHKTIKEVSKYLKTAESISVDKKYKNQVENGVIAYYTEQGFSAIFVENYIWRATFALLFWDIIFDSHIHQPFQKRPSDFYTKNFFEQRKHLFSKQLDEMQSKEKLQEILEKNYQSKQGIQNPFILWHTVTLPLCVLLVELLPIESLKKVLLVMAQDMKNALVGFPDILIWKGKEYCWIEVKSPTDSLSAQQLFWLQFFTSNHIQAKVLRVLFV
jgi:hypothetical protein